MCVLSLRCQIKWEMGYSIMYMSATSALGGTCACVSSGSRSTTPNPREPACARQHDHRPIGARGGVREDDKHTRRCSQAAGVLLAGSEGFLVPLGVPNGPCSPRLPSAPQHVRGGDRALSRCWAGQQVVAHRFRSMLRTSSCHSCRGWLRPRLALGWPRLALRRVSAIHRRQRCQKYHRCQRRRRRWLACSSLKACWRERARTSSRRRTVSWSGGATPA